MPTSLDRDRSDQVDVFDAIQGRCARMREELGRVVVGQDQVIRMLQVALLSQGHVLMIGVPGLAKTLLARALAAAVGLRFQRIQFTPDMMPSDIIGTELIQTDPTSGHREPVFRPGPIFSQLILADEVNRTPPKTQAALLEAMAERQVTAAGRTMPLEEPCVVIATQNPIEQEGTYPLPEAQLDRFMLSLWLDYPTRDEEVRIAAQSDGGQPGSVEQVFSRDQLLAGARAVAQMPVSPHVVDYAVGLVRATRPTEPSAPTIVRQHVQWGAGPRASQHLLQAAKALAAIQGQPTPNCEHLRELIHPALRHRLVLGFSAGAEGIGEAQVVDAVIQSAHEPSYED